MSVIKYNPARSILFNNFWNEAYESNREKSTSFVPPVDIAESETAYELQLALAGIEKKDIGIELSDNKLVISGERKKKENNNFHTIESNYGQFKRSFILPENINSEKLEAKFKNGLLEISVPKDQKKIAKKNIAIN